MTRLAGRTALVTGASTGIGAAIARLFVAEGANVAICDVNRRDGEALVEELGGQTRFFAHDVSSAAAWADVVAACEQAFGPIGVLVNNAGISGANKPMEEIGEEDYLRLIGINQLGTFLGMKAVLPSMRRAGGGSIINTSSTYGLVGAAGQVDYCAAKFAVTGMTKAAAMELGGENIRVNSVHPGCTRTPMTEKVFERLGEDMDAFVTVNPIPRWADPMELAQMYLFLASDAGSFCTGGAFAVDGGLTAQ